MFTKKFMPVSRHGGFFGNLPVNFFIVKPHEGHGFEVPMHYLDRQLPPNLETEKILVTVPSYEHYYEWGKRYGEAYDRSDLRTAIIASADLSHVLKPEGLTATIRRGLCLIN